MGRFYEEIGQTIKRDELFGGADGVPVALRNCEVAVDAKIKRGMVLAADTTFGEYHLATAADVNKILVIARDDFEADSENRVVTAYSSGKFNRQRLILAEGANVNDFEESLRKVDIKLTTLKEIFGKE